MSKFFILLALCAGLIAGVHLQSKIVGGDVVDIKNFPYQVSVHYNDMFLCNGAIITTTAIVTTASCMSGTPLSGMYIRAGSAERTSGGVTINVIGVHPHPSHTMLSADYDISIMIIESPLVFGETINTIELPGENQVIPIDTEAVVSGWGSERVGGSMSEELRAVSVNTINQGDCYSVYGTQLTGRMFCFQTDSDRDSCQGDTGAPVVINGQLMGVISWGYQCGNSNYPRVVSSIPAMRAYVNDIAGI